MSSKEFINLELAEAINQLEAVKADSGTDTAVIDLAVVVLTNIGTRMTSHQSPEQICEDLFDTYFAFQDVLSDKTPARHILRVVGDDVSMSLDVDMDDSWRLYEKALARKESGAAVGYAILRQKGLIES